MKLLESVVKNAVIWHRYEFLLNEFVRIAVLKEMPFYLAMQK